MRTVTVARRNRHERHLHLRAIHGAREAEGEARSQPSSLRRVKARQRGSRRSRPPSRLSTPANRTVTLKGPRGQRTHAAGRTAGQELRADQGRRSRRRALLRGPQARAQERRLGHPRAQRARGSRAGEAGRAACSGSGATGHRRRRRGRGGREAPGHYAARWPKRTVELKVRDPKQPSLVKVGDQVEATPYTEALAVSVEPAPPAKQKQ